MCKTTMFVLEGNQVLANTYKVTRDKDVRVDMTRSSELWLRVRACNNALLTILSDDDRTAITINLGMTS